MIQKSKISAKKEWNRRVKIKHFTALSISSSFKLLCASVCYFWLMQSSYFTITYQINRKLRALKSLRTAGKGKTSSQKNEHILGKEMSPKTCVTIHPPWCAILTNSTTPGPTTGEVPLALWRSQNPAGSTARQDSTHSPRSQQDANTAEISLFANAIEQLVPPSPSGIPIHKYLHGRESHVTTPGSSRWEKSPAVLAFQEFE